jgi:hypothetical protein
MKILTLLLLSVAAAAFGEPQLSNPIGAPSDALFTDADLLDIQYQFSDSTATYFANAGIQVQNIICIDVPWQSGLSQCSPKAELYIIPQYVPVTYPPPAVPVPPGPPVTPPTCTVNCEPPPCVDCGTHPAVPEPGYLGLMILVLVVVAIWRKVRRA